MDRTGRVHRDAVISVTAGILSVLLFPLVGWIPGIVGLRYGNRVLRENGDAGGWAEGLAAAGRVCSVVGISLSVVSLLLAAGGLVLFA